MLHEWVDKLSKDEQCIVAKLMADAYLEGVHASWGSTPTVNREFRQSATNAKIEVLFGATMSFGIEGSE
jgi:hypothetical protein